MPRPLCSTAATLAVDGNELPRRGAAGSAEPGAGPSQGVADLYRSLVETAVSIGRRRRLDLVTEAALIGIYLVLRTMGADAQALGPWLVAALIVTLLAPTSGLVVLAAIAPFSEGFLLTRDVGAKTVLGLAVLAAVALRYAVDRTARIRPSLPVVLAMALFIVSGLSLVETRLRWGNDYATAAAQIWLQGVGVMLVIFGVGAWTARRGELRPVAVAVGAATVAGLMSLADFVVGPSVHDGILSWALAGDPTIPRLTGVTQSPTATAALVMLPMMVLLTVAVLAPVRRMWRVAAALLAVPLLAAAYLTYNRAVFIALFALVVLLGWRVRRRLGVAILAAGLVASVILVPLYLSSRIQALGNPVEPGQVLIASDQQRLGAWAAAGRMFLDQPLIGQGYRAYRQLSIQFGDPTLNAPHSEWLRFFAEGGLVAGGLALAFVSATVMRMARRPDWRVTACLAAFASMVIASSFNNPFLFNQVTIPAFLIAGTGLGLAERAREFTTPDG